MREGEDSEGSGAGSDHGGEDFGVGEEGGGSFLLGVEGGGLGEERGGILVGLGRERVTKEVYGGTAAIVVVVVMVAAIRVCVG